MNSLTIAELRKRAADLEYKTERLALTIPGRNSATQYAERKRAQEMAADFRLLANIAEGY